MSVYQLRSLPCSLCGADRVVKIADSANPLRHPPFREDLLRRCLHRFGCAVCGHVDVHDGPMLWTDVRASLVAWVVPVADRMQWLRLEEVARHGLEHVVRSEGPSFVRDWGATARLRLVFGFEELREKVIATEHGLDDAALEVLKLPFVDHDRAEAPVLEEVSDEGLRLAMPVDVTGTDAAGSIGRTVAVLSWAEYDATVAARDELEVIHPGLYRGTWVSWGRSGFPPMNDR